MSLHFFLRHIQSIYMGSNIQCLKQIDYKQIEYIACSVLCNFEDSLHFYVAPSEMRIPHWTSAASMLNIFMTYLEGLSCFKKVWCLISREYMIYDNEMLYNIKGRNNYIILHILYYNYNREGVYFVMGSWCTLQLVMPTLLIGHTFTIKSSAFCTMFYVIHFRCILPRESSVFSMSFCASTCNVLVGVKKNPNSCCS